MMESKAALADKCMSILCKHIGVLEAEKFILYLRTEGFDYTSWQREHYDGMTPEEIHAGIVRNGKAHPFHGKKSVIL